NPILQKEEREIQVKHKEVSRAVGSYLRQKAKISWIKDGDQNTSMFHQAIWQRSYRNRILTITDEQGNMISSQDNIFDSFVQFYKQLFTRRQDYHWNENIVERGHKLTTEQQLALLRPFTDDEINQVCFSTHIDKAPGPDGYGAGFFKAAWSIIGEDCVKAIREFFNSGTLLNSINATNLVMIPKSDTPTMVKDYRPIACCNYNYKCISKLICARMSSDLPSLIQDNQTSFIQDRIIVQHILITQELLRLYGRRNNSPRCLMKIDIRKAYDTLDWNFIEDMLSAFKFPAQFRRWIMCCVTTASYKISVNGQNSEPFKGSRGLRQGDPVSPLLFVLAMEVLTRGLQEAAEHKNFIYHPLCKDHKLISLAFADDLMVFCKGHPASVIIPHAAIQRFSKSSCLHPSMEKSQIYMAGLNEEKRNELINMTGFQKGMCPFKYLGIPISAKKWSNATCQLLVDKFSNRIQSWKTRSLSYQARCVLINSVLMSLHVYWSSIFIIPKAVLKGVERKCKELLWGLDSNDHYHASVAWEFVCRPKQNGGLNFKNTVLWNITTLGKQVWHIAAKKDSLWVRWISSIYLKNQDIWQTDIKQGDSWHWKQLVKVKQKLQNGFSNNNWNATATGEYTIKSGYKFLIGSLSAFPWQKMTWNSLSIPKHNFIVWLAMLNKLKTRDRLFVQQNTCTFCNTTQDEENFFLLDNSLFINVSIFLNN
ncbi:MAG: reverse transcriptase family protein, partial [Sweet potato little leaf phytoplasma]|nr:reverse transcriptase family protein [Sweet potato little leaf phytoplasma]